MAHPETEALNDTHPSETPIEKPENEESYHRGPVTKALTVEGAAAELDKIFENDPSEKAIERRKYNEQKTLSKNLKALKLKPNNDLDPEQSEHSDTEADTDNYEINDHMQDAEHEVAINQETEFDEENGTEDQDEDLSAIPAPISWSKQQKKIFEALPPEAQDVIVERERERDKGFQVKATELAQQRRQLEEIEQQAILERQMYADTLSQQVGAQMVEPNIEELNPNSPTYNPNKYWADKENYDALAAQQQQLQQHSAKYQNLIEQNAQLAQAEFINLNHQRLAENIPDWENEQHRGELIRFGVMHGYTPEDVQTANPEEVTLLNKAMKFDILMAQMPQVQSQVKKAPKVQKPGAKKRGTSNRRALADATKKLKRTGSTEDAAAVLSHIMKD